MSEPNIESIFGTPLYYNELDNYEITDNNLTDNKLNNEKQIHKAQINQNYFFNLNYLA